MRTIEVEHAGAKFRVAFRDKSDRPMTVTRLRSKKVGKPMAISHPVARGAASAALRELGR